MCDCVVIMYKAWSQVESGKVVANEDICALVDKANRIAVPCIETLGKVI